MMVSFEPVHMALMLQVTPPAGGAVAAAILGVATVAVMAGVMLFIAMRRRRDRRELDDLASNYRFELVEDPEEVDRVRAFVDKLFGEGPKIGRMLCKRQGGLQFHLVTMRVPLFRVDAGGEWDQKMQESQEKLVLFVSDLDVPLPPFRLMPNSWALTTVRGKEANICHAIEPFGFRNYVIAREKDRVIQLLSGDPMHLLRRNRQLTIDAREHYLAFYLQDERPQPPNLPAFVEESLQLAEAIHARAVKYAHPQLAEASA
jgi:hypothetical protein